MKRYYLLASIFCLLSVLGAVAMEQPSIPEGKQEIEENEQTITVEFENGETLEDVLLDECKQSRVFNDMLKSCGNTIPKKWLVDLLSKEDFEAIRPLLTLLADPSVYDESKKKLVKEELSFYNLSDSFAFLTTLLNIANYLEVSLILEVGADIYGQKVVSALNALSQKNYVEESVALLDEQISKLHMSISAYPPMTAALKKQISYFLKTYEVPVVELIGHNKPVLSACFSPDGKLIASASYDRTIKVWDVAVETYIKTLSGHAKPVSRVCFSPDSKQLVSASVDKTIKIWDVKTGTCTKTLSDCKFISCVCFSPNGKQLVCALYDRDERGRVITFAETKVWDIETEGYIKTLPDPAWCVCFSPDGKLLACALLCCRTIKIWDVETETYIKTLTGHDRVAYAMNFSPDSKLLASASHHIKVWNIETGTCKKSTKHDTPVCSVNFSPDGRQLISASSSGSVKLWDLEKNACIKKFGGHNKAGKSANFSPDGRQLISSSSSSNAIKLWNIGAMPSTFDKLTLPQTMLLYMIENGSLKNDDIYAHDSLRLIFTSLSENLQNQCGYLLKKTKSFMPIMKTVAGGLTFYSNYVNKSKGYQKIGN